MITMKRSMKTASFALALFLAITIFPMVTYGEENVQTDTTIDFGNVNIGSPSTHNLEITNISADYSALLSFSLSGAGACGVSYDTSGSSGTLPAGETMILPVTFLPSSEVTCTGYLLVSAKFIDPDGRAIKLVRNKISLSGTGVEPIKNIIIDGRDTGIEDMPYGDQNASDYINDCAENARNHRKFVKCVAKMAKDLWREGAITKPQRRTLIKYTKMANIPPKQGSGDVVEVSEHSTIIINGRETGVEDGDAWDGQSISELLAGCAENGNHGQFVRCVAKVTKKLKRADLITGKEKRILRRCAAKKNHH